MLRGLSAKPPNIKIAMTFMPELPADVTGPKIIPAAGMNHDISRGILPHLKRLQLFNPPFPGSSCRTVQASPKWAWQQVGKPAPKNSE